MFPYYPLSEPPQGLWPTLLVRTPPPPLLQVRPAWARVGVRRGAGPRHPAARGALTGIQVPLSRDSKTASYLAHGVGNVHFEVFDVKTEGFADSQIPSISARHVSRLCIITA